jgi:hypothetical protein
MRGSPASSRRRPVEAQTDGIPPAFFFPDADEATVLRHGWLVPQFADAEGPIGLRVQAFVVEEAGRLIVVDPCVGNGKAREQPFWNDQTWPFMERFEAVGFDRADVEMVVHTHLLGTHFPTVPGGRLAAEGRVWRFTSAPGQRP